MPSRACRSKSNRGNFAYAVFVTFGKPSDPLYQVIVGANGSGKSTILKLATRLYDVSEGEILIDGHDIRTLKLADLRQAVSVLFQDYTHFPVSVSPASCAMNASQPISTY